MWSLGSSVTRHPMRSIKRVSIEHCVNTCRDKHKRASALGLERGVRGDWKFERQEEFDSARAVTASKLRKIVKWRATVDEDGHAKANVDDYDLRAALIPLNGTAQMFERLIHADWSAHDEKKWMATAERTPQGWQVAAPRLVPCASELIDCWLFGDRTVLAGFDFPIGVPAAFGRRTRFADFPEALADFGSGE